MTEIEIMYLRTNLGLSQRRFAAKIGVTLRAVQSWEQGWRSPSGPAVEKILQLQNTKQK